MAKRTPIVVVRKGRHQLLPEMTGRCIERRRVASKEASPVRQFAIARRVPDRNMVWREKDFVHMIALAKAEGFEGPLDGHGAGPRKRCTDQFESVIHVLLPCPTSD